MSLAVLLLVTRSHPSAVVKLTASAALLGLVNKPGSTCEREARFIEGVVLTRKVVVDMQRFILTGERHGASWERQGASRERPGPL